MSAMQYGILVVEDDFRIADLHAAFIAGIEGFHLVAKARNGDEARALMAEHADAIQLVLLDTYLPDVEGLELLWFLRNQYTQVDIVMLTAAREVETISEALRGGVFDYLIKPVEAIRLEQMLNRFREEKQLLATRQEMDQAQLDRLLARTPSVSTAVERRNQLPKGIDPLTLQQVSQVLAAAESQTAMQVAQETGMSRSTTRRYLEYLVAEQVAEAMLSYGDVGRPERRYRLLPGKQAVS